MARRHSRLHWALGWSFCFFLAGCLSRTGSQRDLPLASLGPKAESAEVEPTNPPADARPEYYSPYRAVGLVQPIARLSGSLDPPPDRVSLEVTPVPPPTAKEAPKEPPAKPDPPKPAKDPPILAALRLALEKHPDEARLVLEKSATPDRDLILALLRLTAGVDKGALPELPSEEVEKTLEHLEALTEHLRKRAPLSLGKVCFCRKIENFGQYDPVKSEHSFQAGCDGLPGERVQVYAEVRNFGSHPRDGYYETVLTSALEIRDAQGQPMVTMSLGTCTDRSHTPRQDYFLNFQFHVPRRLPPGLYTLWVTVKDVTPAGAGQPICKRVAKRSLDFKVCPPGTRPMPAK
jgi:hypothetical protein